jgi:hypothetical protein
MPSTCGSVAGCSREVLDRPVRAAGVELNNPATCTDVDTDAYTENLVKGGTGQLRMPIIWVDTENISRV